MQDQTSFKLPCRLHPDSQLLRGTEHPFAPSITGGADGRSLLPGVRTGLLSLLLYAARRPEHRVSMQWHHPVSAAAPQGCRQSKCGALLPTPLSAVGSVLRDVGRGRRRPGGCGSQALNAPCQGSRVWVVETILPSILDHFSTKIVLFVLETAVRLPGGGVG